MIRWLPLVLAATLLTAGCPGRQSAPEAASHEAHDEHHDEDHDEHHDENVVHMAPEAQAKAGVRVLSAAKHTLPLSLTATGEFEANADKEAHVAPRVAGRVVKLYRTVGDRVGAGEPLALLESMELGEAQSEFLQAQAQTELGRSTLSRQRELFKNDLTAKKELLAAESELKRHEIELERSRNRLRLFGFDDAKMATLARTRKLDTAMALRAPIAGVVVSKHVTLGETLSPDAQEPAFVLSDPSELWVNANLYERDLAKVRQGQRAAISTPAYPGRTYWGHVKLISTTMDKDTRTAQARVVVANADGRLKPEMFATIAIRLGDQSVLAIPQSAVQREKEAIFAFVRTAPDTFERRPITIGEPTTDMVPVLSGLSAGEQVVVDGGITLKAELLKASFGEHHH